MSPFPTPAHPSLDAVPVSSEIRKIYPRDFFPNANTVRLPLGKTAYWLFGPENGPKVALIHGISTPGMVWKHLAPFLAENGFRVLVYDIFGRGYSEAPETIYNADLYATQLALLLQHVQFANVHIVGLSLGGGIAAGFAATFPNLVSEKVVFLASAGLVELPAYVSQATAETVTEMGVAVADPFGPIEKFRLLQCKCLPGFPYALASTIKDGPLRGMENAFKIIAETPRLKCSIIHGNKDTTVHIKVAEKLKGLLPAAEFHIIDGADHDLIWAEEFYEPVQVAILKFLKS